MRYDGPGWRRTTWTAQTTKVQGINVSKRKVSKRVRERVAGTSEGGVRSIPAQRMVEYWRRTLVLRDPLDSQAHGASRYQGRVATLLLQTSSDFERLRCEKQMSRDDTMLCDATR